MLTQEEVMKQRVFYVSRDPGHAGWWIVAAAAMRALSFQSREQALHWALREASMAGAGVSARVLLQDQGEQWECAFASDLPSAARVGAHFVGNHP